MPISFSSELYIYKIRLEFNKPRSTSSISLLLSNTLGYNILFDCISKSFEQEHPLESNYIKHSFIHSSLVITDTFVSFNFKEKVPLYILDFLKDRISKYLNTDLNQDTFIFTYVIEVSNSYSEILESN